MTMLQQIREACAYIRSCTASNPKTAIVLGTGLNGLADHIQVSNRSMSFTESWSQPSSYFDYARAGGTVSWDAKNRILTLKDLYLDPHDSGTLDGSHQLSGLIINTFWNVTINVVGENHIVVECGQALELHGSVTFTGSGYIRFYNS